MIGEKIKKRRECLKLSQSKLAKIAGVNLNTLVKIETGQVENPTVGILRKVAEALKVDLGFLTQEDELNTMVGDTDTLQFLQKSPEEFVDITSDLLNRLYARDLTFIEIETWDKKDDGGKDIRLINSKENTIGYYQCKRYRKITKSELKKELEKIADDFNNYYKNRGLKIEKVVFVLACNVDNRFKEATTDLAKQLLSLNNVIFWEPRTLTSKLRTFEEIINNYFPAYLNKKVIESIKELTIQSANDKKEILEKVSPKYNTKDNIIVRSHPLIKKSSEKIAEGDLDSAETLLIALKESLNEEQDPNLTGKILNNLGVIELRRGNTDQAISLYRESYSLSKDTKSEYNLLWALLESKNNILKNEAIQKVTLKWKDYDKVKSKEEKDLLVRLYIKLTYLQTKGSKIKAIKNNPNLVKRMKDSPFSFIDMCNIYAESGDVDNAIKTIQEGLSISYDPQLLLEKARLLLFKAQAEHISAGWKDFIPQFDDDGRSLISESIKISEDILDIVDRKSQPELFYKTSVVLIIALMWLNKRIEALKVQKDIYSVEGYSKFINEQEKRQLDNLEVLIALKDRDYAKAEEIINKDESLKNVSGINKLPLIREFIEYGAVELAKSELDRCIKVEQEIVEPDFWFAYGIVSVLTNNKISAFNAANKVINIAKERNNEELLKVAVSNKAAIAYRYKDEADELVQTSLKLQELLPEEKIIWPITPFDENKKITPDFQRILDNQREAYEKQLKLFKSHPFPIYSAPRIFGKDITDFLESQYDPRLYLEFNFMENDFIVKQESLLKDNDVIILDFITLLDLGEAKTLDLLRYLKKDIVITRSTFQMIQNELIETNSEGLSNAWNFIRNEKSIKLVEVKANDELSKLTAKLLDQHVVESMSLAINGPGILVSNDIRAIQLLEDRGGKGINLYPIIKQLRGNGHMDERAYISLLRVFASRQYRFLPFSGKDLYSLVSKDNFKLTVASRHLVNEIHLPGSHINSFIGVFIDFFIYVANGGLIFEDKVNWFKILVNNTLTALEDKVRGNSISASELVDSLNAFGAGSIHFLNSLSVEERGELMDTINKDNEISNSFKGMLNKVFDKIDKDKEKKY